MPEIEELAEEKQRVRIPRGPAEGGDGEEGEELHGLEHVRDLGHPVAGVHALPA